MSHPNYKPIYAALLAVLLTPNAHADSKHYFNIPAQPLNQALLTFGKQSGQQLMYSTAVADHLHSRPVQGEFTASEAVNLLLAAAPLQAVPTREGTLTLRPKAMAVATSESTPQSTTLPLMKVTGAAEYEQDDTDPNDHYSVSSASTATKIDLPIMDIPQSIQVIPRKLIQDRQILRLNDVGENVSGVTKFPGYGGLGSSGFFMRGFNLRGESLRNGFRDFGFLSPREVANLDRVEFLKGPASVLYGGSAQGLSGVVNTVTKKPLDTPMYQANMTFGSFDLYRPTFDVTGPVGHNIPVNYRLNFAYENGNSFRDFTSTDRVFVAPAFTWLISPATTFTLELDHQQDDYTHDLGLPFEPESLQLPNSRFLGVPGFNRAQVQGDSITYNLEHKFNDEWRFRQGFNANVANANIDTTYYYGGFEADSRNLLTREADRSVENQENFAVQNELYGKFNTGSVKHNFMVGTELARYDFHYNFLYKAIPSIDIFNPVYNTNVDTSIWDGGYKGGYGSDNFALYSQDMMTLLPKLKLLFGGRYDWTEYKSDSDWVNNPSVGNDHFSPRLGLVYQPLDNTSLYFQWGNAFMPSFPNYLRPTNQTYKPQTSEQFEFGIKQQFLEQRVTATLAFYHLTKQNLTTRDLNDKDVTDGIDQIQVGEQRSQGIEFDLAGEILPGWNLITAYAYTEAVVTKDNNDLQGQKLPNAPRHNGSVWTSYELQSGTLKGLGIGGGVFYVGERETTLPNTLHLADYVRADASVFYNWKNYRFAVNVKNLNDVKTYNPGGDFLIPEPPLTVLGTISVKY